VEDAGTWRLIMAFPPGVYDLLVGQFETMAGGAPALRLVWRGAEATVAMEGHRGAAGREDLALMFRSS
jgi:hypothetical protein